MKWTNKLVLSAYLVVLHGEDRHELKIVSLLNGTWANGYSQEIQMVNAYFYSKRKVGSKANVVRTNHGLYMKPGCLKFKMKTPHWEIFFPFLFQ